MGTLTLPASGLGYLDAKAMIYTVAGRGRGIEGGEGKAFRSGEYAQASGPPAQTQGRGMRQRHSVPGFQSPHRPFLTWNGLDLDKAKAEYDPILAWQVP